MILFWDTILKESPADCYKDYGYETKGTNPCFTADTLVARMLPGGERYEKVPISDIKVGDKVLSYNTKKDKLEFKKVKFSGLTRENAEIITVRVLTAEGDESELRCTPDHRFYNHKTGRYEPPYEGMILSISATKESSAFIRESSIAQITNIYPSGTADVYDIGVFGNHNFYAGESQVLVHNCSELPLSPYDSCRLISMNLYSYVDDPFTERAKFNTKKFKKHVVKAQKLMDDLVDLEIEKIDKILDKISSDPESDDIKHTEMSLWNKVRKATKTARRTGLGVTAVGDAIAALGLTYGSDESIVVIKSIFAAFATSSYESSILMARDRGAFDIWDKDLEVDNQFISRVLSALSKDFIELYNIHGRRNIANLTLAPTGTTSLMTQTTSGVEPLFTIKYTRRRKVMNKSSQKSTFKDRTGDEFEEFTVWHPKFLDYLRVRLKDDKDLWNNHPMDISIGYNTLSNQEIANHLEQVDTNILDKLISESPYYKATAQDINWVSKVKLQGAIQMWVDHAISATTNIPKDTSLSTVSDIYKAAYEYGCKGETIYRDGSRDGILIPKESTVTTGYKRNEYLDCKVVRFKNGNENWIAFVGVLDNKPVELFTGKIDDDLKFLPKSIDSGVIKQVRRDEEGRLHRYDFIYDIKFGYKNTLPDIGSCFNSEYWNYAIMVSEMLRSNIKLDKIINILENLSTKENSMNVWNRGVARALRRFVKDGTESESACPDCGTKLVYENGCKHCNNCGYSACN